MLNPAMSNLIKEIKKPCPFCGGKAHLWRWGRKFNKVSREYAVRCCKCLTQSEPSECPTQAIANWYTNDFSEFQRKANEKLKADKSSGVRTGAEMGEIVVTKITAIEYLKNLIKINNERHCELSGCTECKYSNTACATPDDIERIGVEENIRDVMMFEMTDKSEIDWYTVKKDTLIEVSGDNKKWYRRYFAMYEGERVYVYVDGRTSKTEKKILDWEFARLADED